MTLAQNRELLRAELLAAAAAVAPGQQAVVTQDSGPINPAVMFGSSGPATICMVTVETGDPARAKSGALQIVAAGHTLRDRGWQIDAPTFESGHHRLTGNRDGFEIAIHAWDSDWKVTLTGQTPLP